MERTGREAGQDVAEPVGQHSPQPVAATQSRRPQDRSGYKTLASYPLARCRGSGDPSLPHRELEQTHQQGDPEEQQAALQQGSCYPR